MKERPILFSGPMVRALLAGTKTQTRRVCKPAEAAALSYVVEVPDPAERGQVYNGSTFGDEAGDVQFSSPYGGRGDRLWVCETFAKIIGQSGGGIETDYAATYTQGDRLGDTLGIKKRWTPSIHMPRDASRILLEITGVRVERLQDISEADALAEGIVPREVIVDTRYEAGQHREIEAERFLHGEWPQCKLFESAEEAYADLWEQINGPGSWDANPWVWVVEFKRIEQPEAAL